MTTEPASAPVPPAGMWEPRIVAFFCNWCTYTAADLAGVSRLKYAPNVRVIRLMCSGRVDPQFILATLAAGADGVLIGGCHIGDCHYAEGNFKTMRRVVLLKRLLRGFGIAEQRLRLEWISASEGERVKTVIDEMVREIRILGPLALPQQIAAWDAELLRTPASETSASGAAPWSNGSENAEAQPSEAVALAASRTSTAPPPTAAAALTSDPLKPTPDP